jgi:hypothetical protein
MIGSMRNLYVVIEKTIDSGSAYAGESSHDSHCGIFHEVEKKSVESRQRHHVTLYLEGNVLLPVVTAHGTGIAIVADVDFRKNDSHGSVLQVHVASSLGISAFHDAAVGSRKGSGSIIPTDFI